MNKKTKELSTNVFVFRSTVVATIVTALFIALTYMFIAFLPIQIPGLGSGGLTHLGNIPMFVGAILFGKRVGALAGGIGMALFDLFSPYAIWAPYTLIIVGIMGYVIGLIAEKHSQIQWYVFAIVIALLIKVVGYYFAEVILLNGDFITPVFSIVANVSQVVVAGVIVIPLIKPIKSFLTKANIIH